VQLTSPHTPGNHGFGPRPIFEAILAERDGRVVGSALYFFTFSTFTARPTLYLEDLFVRPEERGRGIGRKLLVALAWIAVERECGRMEWSVLDWNTPARDFYFKLGAVAMDEWTVFRMTPEAFGPRAGGRADHRNSWLAAGRQTGCLGDDGALRSTLP
jgi:GNAT superfamily N-acetyltransferase